MQTPFGDIAVCDAHVHCFSHGFFCLLAQQKSGLTVESIGEQLGWEMPPENPAQLASRWVQELDRHGLARAALIASLPGDEASVLAAVKSYPDRFYGFFMVNPLAADAPAKVTSWLAQGLRVPCFFPAMHGYSMQHPAAIATLEAIAATPKPVVFVHCGVLSVGVRKRLGLPSLFDLRYSNPIDLHSLAMRFSNVNFIVPHFGAGYFRETLMLADLCANVYLDTSSTNSWMEYIDIGLTLEKVFHQCLDVLGAHRLLFGTDSSHFPRGWHRAIFDLQTAALKALGVGNSDAKAIFGGNLDALLSS
ncbi:MAG: amidohydrolase family protein [Bryobacteraceae bacterium]|nr:amidohydrolase family protein [Bryobacteraceae bacterium]MDW8377660.1 amidohydrolase family protein [Bryobacterales bacterium]